METSPLRLVAVLVLLLFAGAASARTPKEFDLHVDAAKRFYSEKNYDKAIEEFTAAYQLDPEPLLLLSIGRCHNLAERPRDALTFYTRAQHAKLTPQEREEVSASILAATVKMRDQDRQAAERERLAMEQRRRADQAELVALVSSGQKVPEKKPLYKTAWFWGVVGGSVAVVGLSLGLGLGLALRQGPSTPMLPADQIP